MRSVVDNVPVCEPIKIVPYYYDAIQLVHSGAMTTHDVSLFHNFNGKNLKNVKILVYPR